jgi:hypothetical protein
MRAVAVDVHAAADRQREVVEVEGGRDVVDQQITG